jgi:hypothetical protein
MRGKDDWAGHQNHVHTKFTQAVAVGGIGSSAGMPLTMPAADAAAGATDLGAAIGAAMPPVNLVLPSQIAAAAAPASITALGSTAVDMSRLYDSGAGTPGFQDGQPGYFRTDPKTLREAEQRAQDALGRVTESDAAAAKAVRDADQRAHDAYNRMIDADAAVAAALARVNELDATASEEQRRQAEEALRKARVAADTARREADDATTDGADSIRKARADAQTARREARDADEDAKAAQRGTFSPAKKDGKDKAAGGGKGELGEIGNIAGSFLKETFGLDGSLFPDLSNLAPVKALGTVLGAFQGGATASDPFGGQVDTGAATSGLPFGMIPGVSSMLPPTSPMEPGAPNLHLGSGGQPGPVDASTNITIVNPQGDEQSIANRTRQTLLRTPRLNTYTAPGVGQ